MGHNNKATVNRWLKVNGKSEENQLKSANAKKLQVLETQLIIFTEQLTVNIVPIRVGRQSNLTPFDILPWILQPDDFKAHSFTVRMNGEQRM